MAAGYLDLLQRELKKTVIHQFPDAATLDLTAGIEGQIAATVLEGSFYIFTANEWKRILNEDDLAAIATAGVQAISIDIPNPSALTYVWAHGLAGRPVIEVTGNGKVIVIEVAHDELGTSTLTWKGTLPIPAKATATGVPI